MHKPVFKELAAALADEVASVRRPPLYRADRALQKAQPVTNSRADHDSFPSVVEDVLQDEGEVFVEDWLETQLLDCQNLARRHGFIELARRLDEALDALVDGRQGSADAPGDWRARPQQ